MNEIREKFAEIRDERDGSYVKHKLCDILILVMGAVICGMTELSEMMEYFENKLPFYTTHFGIKKYPSKATLSRILNMVDPRAVGEVIVQIMLKNTANIGEIVAIDGKSVRSTSIKGKPHSALQILTAFCTESGVILGQEPILHEDKTNEIPIFQDMLECLDIKGKTITADAMHCQKETCRKITEKEGFYFFGLKENQKNFYDDVKLFFESEINDDECEKFITIEQNGGRIEKRICRKCENIDWFYEKSEWYGLKNFVEITRKITYSDKETVETGYYITSRTASAEEMLKISREHWKIESMHWMLDVIWKEDFSGILSDNGNEVLNILRKIALFAHKKYVKALPKKRSVKSNVLSALLNDNVFLDVIGSL